VVQPDGSKKYFVGTSIGLYSTTLLVPATTVANDNTVWSQEATSVIGTNIVNHLSLRNADYTLAVSTHGAGAFVSKLYDAPNTVSYPAASSELYPNPAAQFTKLVITPGTNADLNIWIHDMQGKVVYRASYAALSASVPQVIYIPTSHLAQATYVVNTQLGADKPKCTKLIVAR
jgi:hypothetical protein